MSLDWEACYEARDMRWDKGEAAPPLVDYLAAHPITGDVLVPGCGLGYDVRVLAQQRARVTGLDIAPKGLHLAHQFLPAAAEQYRLGDFLKPEDDLLGAFDWMVEHTLFCAIDRELRAQYPPAAHAILKPGGRLLAIHYMEVEDESLDGPPWGATLEELDSLFTPHFELIEQYRAPRTYAGREGRELVRLLQAKL